MKKLLLTTLICAQAVSLQAMGIQTSIRTSSTHTSAISKQDKAQKETKTTEKISAASRFARSCIQSIYGTYIMSTLTRAGSSWIVPDYAPHVGLFFGIREGLLSKSQGCAGKAEEIAGNFVGIPVGLALHYLTFNYDQVLNLVKNGDSSCTKK